MRMPDARGSINSEVARTQPFRILQVNVLRGPGEASVPRMHRSSPSSHRCVMGIACSAAPGRDAGRDAALARACIWRCRPMGSQSKRKSRARHRPRNRAPARPDAVDGHPTPHGETAAAVILGARSNPCMRERHVLRLLQLDSSFNGQGARTVWPSGFMAAMRGVVVVECRSNDGAKRFILSASPRANRKLALVGDGR